MHLNATINFSYIAHLKNIETLSIDIQHKDISKHLKHLESVRDLKLNLLKKDLKTGLGEIDTEIKFSDEILSNL